jgi:cytoskeletal protein CcmA (bactofilin family)
MYISGNVDGKGASLTIYANGEKFEITNNARVNANTQQPSRLVMHHLYDDSTKKIELENNSQTWACAWAPYGEFKVKDEAQFWGKARALKLKVENDGQAHADTRGGDSDPGLVADDTIEIKGHARLDAMDGGTAVIACNSVGSAVIKLDDESILKGDAYGGAGGVGGNSEIKVGSTAQITGETGNLTEAVEIAVPDTPVVMPDLGDESYKGNHTSLIRSSFTCNKFELKNNHVIEIDGDVTIVVEGDMKWEDNGAITLREGASLTMYFAKKFEIKDDVRINVDGNPSRLTLYNAGHEKIEFKNRTRVCAKLTAPESEVKVKDDSHFYGSILCKKLKVEKNGQLHYDTSGTGSRIWR